MVGAGTRPTGASSAILASPSSRAVAAIHGGRAGNTGGPGEHTGSGQPPTMRHAEANPKRLCRISSWAATRAPSSKMPPRSTHSGIEYRGWLTTRNGLGSPPMAQRRNCRALTIRHPNGSGAGQRQEKRMLGRDGRAFLAERENLLGRVRKGLAARPARAGSKRTRGG